MRSKLTIIDSDNGLSPDRRQAIIWTNAGILLIGPFGTTFSEISIEIITFSFKKMRLKVSSAKWRPFCLGLNVLISVLVYQILLEKKDAHLYLWISPNIRLSECHWQNTNVMVNRPYGAPKTDNKHCPFDKSRTAITFVVFLYGLVHYAPFHSPIWTWPPLCMLYISDFS